MDPDMQVEHRESHGGLGAGEDPVVEDGQEVEAARSGKRKGVWG